MITKRILAALLVSLALLAGCTVTTSTSTGGLTVEDFKFGEGAEGPFRSEAKFKEGEKVYLVFKVKGFKQGDDKKVTLGEALTVTGPDGNKIIDESAISLLDEVQSSSVNEVSAHNDLTMPAGLPSGKYEVKMVLTDKIGGGTTTHNSSFQWEGSGQAATGGGGDEVNAGDLRVTNFRFSQSEGGPTHEEKTFAPGDEVWMMFGVEGFKMAEDTTIWVQEDLTVSDAEGTPILQKENLVDLKDKNPNNETVVSFNNDVSLPASAPAGTYKVNMTIRDKQGNQQIQYEDTFEVVEAGTGDE